MNTDTGRLTLLLHNLEARLSLDVAARSLSKWMRRSIIFGLLGSLLTIGIVLHNGYASHRWRAHEKAQWVWQDRMLRHLDWEISALRRDDREDRHDLPIARRRF
jgi:hypothetical protein